MKKIKKSKVVRKPVKKTAKKKVVARRVARPAVVIPPDIAKQDQAAADEGVNVAPAQPNDNVNPSETTAAAEGTVAQSQTSEPVGS